MARAVKKETTPREVPRKWQRRGERNENVNYDAARLSVAI